MNVKTDKNSPAPRWGRRCFVFFLRLLRLFIIVLVLAVAAAAWYLREVGLPEFAKQRLIAQFKIQGWRLDFSRLRWRGWGLVVADGIQLRPVHRAGGASREGPQFFVEEARCEFHHSEVKNFHLELDAIGFSGGQMLWPVPATNRQSSLLILRDLGGLVRARSDNAWELSFLQGFLSDIKLNVRGAIQHASLLRQLKITKPEKEPAKVRLDWGQLLQGLRAVQFEQVPQLVIRFQADGAELNKAKADFKFSVPGLHSRWGSATNLLLTLGLQAPSHWGAAAPVRASNSVLRANLHFTADQASTPWGQATALRLQAEGEPALSGQLGSNTQVRVELVEPVASYGKARGLTASVNITPAPANTLQSQIFLFANEVQTRWGQAKAAGAQGNIALPPLGEWKLMQTNLDLPTRLKNFSGQAQLNLTQVHSPHADAGHVTVKTGWRWPLWQVEADGNLYGGGLMMAAGLNTTNRELKFSASSDIDVHPFTALLPTNAQRWLADYTNTLPPKIQAQGGLVLPGGSLAGKWIEQVLPTVSGAGHAELAAGAYRGAAFRGVESSFALTNMMLILPRFKVSRDEGSLEGDYTSDLRSSEFQWRLTSQIYPKAGQPFLAHPDARRAFDEVVFKTPPWVQGQVRGAWRKPEHVLLEAQVRATNFTLRGESVKTFQGRIQYTNQVLLFLDPIVEREEGVGRATLAAIDFASQKLYLTNGQSRLDPYAITRAIGQEAVEAIAPYQFASPPQGRVNGVVDLKRQSDLYDLHFEVRGGPFKWQQFQARQIAGEVHWVGKSVGLSNVQGDFNSGRLDGSAYFDFSPPEKGAACSFKANVIDVDLHELLSAWTSKTNHIEGRLNAELNITQGNTELPATWQGFGWLSLRNGLLWEIPMFGLFSPVLNAFVPGLGNSRARKATATCLVTNGVISTSDLEIHATAMRMQIQGAVGFDRQVDARVEAELLRNIPAVGLLVSKVFWPVTKIFEYKVSGPLDRPKAEPLYVLPKILLAPFHPIKTFRDLLSEERKNE